MTLNGLEFIEETTWQNVWENWMQAEGSDPNWHQVAKEKGFHTWEEWRDSWVQNFNAQTRTWTRYSIMDPFATVPNFKIGPTQAWQKNFPQSEQNQHTFQELIQNVNVDTNTKVQAILNNFPDQTEFIGIYLPDKSIHLIEGHHRASAITIAAQKTQHIEFHQKPTIALTPFTFKELPILDEMLQKGSSKV